MIIVLKKDVTQEQVQHIIGKVESVGLTVHVSQGVERTIIGAIGEEEILRSLPLDALPGVEKVMPILKPYKLVSREFKPDNTVIKFANNTEIGNKKIAIVAGPCAVESRDSLLKIARLVKEAGANFLRGGAFKPRTSPYTFQGLGEEGLKYLAQARQETGMMIVTELMDPRDLDLICAYADIIQIGARNMQNFKLLTEVGKQKKPVLLKRGLSSTIKELLMSAEYIMAQGNYNVILCERGIRTFEDFTRNTLDISAVPVIKSLSHLPIVIDPSHAAGKWALVPALSKAAIAAGADGLLIEVHDNPENALSDGAQSLLPEKFKALLQDLAKIAQAVGREI
ncbi:MAG: 3-deoxy-7-phosphoheptulonate synthase [Candidatus Schekmanbacteria bacterium]|nr:3-deoxy-7-phosphoheptulonate synthase [Candidatus Schekmanbacteria bacterium]